MRQLSRKAAVYAAAAATVVASTTFGIASSQAATSPAQFARGDVRSADSFHIVFSATRAKGAPETAAKGRFAGEAKLAGNRLIRFGGPINCLHVRGSSVGFYYPVTTADPEIAAAFGAGVYIYLDTDGKGRATAFSFLPTPASAVMGCYPLPGVAPATGKAQVGGG